MSQQLLLTVRLHDGRYHGAGDWPPSPARLFQALVAGAGLSGPLDEKAVRALTWLENREPPLIGAPAMRNGQRVVLYVPNNDLDAVGGDPQRIAEVRGAKKLVRPRLFDATIPFLYTWSLGADQDSERHSEMICELADHLYQFGRGVDMAWAVGEVLPEEVLEGRLANYPGHIYHPSSDGVGETLTCPRPGSLESLRERYAANRRRFNTVGHGRAVRQVLSQAPKPRFMSIAYESPPSRHLYELRSRSTEAAFVPWPLTEASKLAVWVRECAAARLRQALSAQSADIDRILIGRKPDGTNDGPTSARVKIVPLPSIGHYHADRGIRRVLVEVPAGCPLRADDIQWAFSGLELCDPATGEVFDTILTPAADDSMLGHYGIGSGQRFRTWRTVTPAALPEAARRRRIEPARRIQEAKDGSERAAEQARAAGAVIEALRHAGVRTEVQAIRVRREPFEAKGARVEAFAPGRRFAKERLWHVEITCAEPLSGPLLIGDGRFLGLGVMAPVRAATPGVHVFMVEGGLGVAVRWAEVARALRRAVMARVQEVLGARALPTFFSGHEVDGLPARAERASHLTLLFDPGTIGPARLLIVAPHIVERRDPKPDERQHLKDLDRALTDFRELRAGSSGRLTLRAAMADADLDPLLAPARTWESLTPYHVTRHAKEIGVSETVAADLRVECRRRGLPEPHVTVHGAWGEPGVGVLGHARLTFRVAVQGPIILGRSRYLGGGLFAGKPSSSNSFPAEPC